MNPGKLLLVWAGPTARAEITVVLNVIKTHKKIKGRGTRVTYIYPVVQTTVQVHALEIS